MLKTIGGHCCWKLPWRGGKSYYRMFSFKQTPTKLDYYKLLAHCRCCHLVSTEQIRSSQNQSFVRKRVLRNILRTVWVAWQMVQTNLEQLLLGAKGLWDETGWLILLSRKFSTTPDWQEKPITYRKTTKIEKREGYHVCVRACVWESESEWKWMSKHRLILDQKGDAI